MKMECTLDCMMSGMISEITGIRFLGMIRIWRMVCLGGLASCQSGLRLLAGLCMVAFLLIRFLLYST